MPADIDPNGQFEPLHASTSIEQVAYVVHFSRPLTDEEFAPIRVAAASLATYLPIRQDLRTFNIALMMNNASMPAAPVEVSTGLGMARADGNGLIQHELKIERQAFSYRWATYAPWNEFVSEIRRCLNSFLHLMPGDIQISVVGLNIVNKFVWCGPAGQATPGSFLNRSTPYLSSHVFDLTSMWHSHTGAFLTPRPDTRRLINVNADCMDEIKDTAVRRLVTLNTMANDSFNVPGFEPATAIARDSLELVCRHLESLHSCLKDVFGSLINSEMKVKVGLRNAS